MLRDRGKCPVLTRPPRLCGRRCSMLSRAGWPCGNPCQLPKNHGEDHRCAYHQDRDQESSGEEEPDVVVSAAYEDLEIVACLRDVPLTKRFASGAGSSIDGVSKNNEAAGTQIASPEDRPPCQCWCGCRRRPGRGCRRHCSACSMLVGPGCCWMGDDVGLCHICSEGDTGYRHGIGSNDEGRGPTPEAGRSGEQLRHDLRVEHHEPEN